MQDPVRIEPVVSGAPYVVVRINGRPPTCYDDFVESPVIGIDLEFGGSALSLSGSSNHHDGHVIVHEKTEDGTGKDIRTWQIQEHADHFEASPISAF